MEYSVKLNPDFEEIEDYQMQSDNILDARIFDIGTGEELKNAYVILSYSKNGMIGMGKNLIRYAQKFRKYSQEQLDPCAYKDIAIERMGVWTTPESNTVLIRCEPDFGNIDEEIFSKIKD